MQKTACQLRFLPPGNLTFSIFSMRDEDGIVFTDNFCKILVLLRPAALSSANKSR